MNEPMIITEGLYKHFGHVKAVEDVNLAIPKGSIYGLLGPNGAGKSTTIRMLCGVITPSGGNAIVDGVSLYGNSELIKQKIGYMSQKFGLYEDLTVFENMTFFASIYGIDKFTRKTRIQELIEMAGLESKVSVLAKHLSGGWKQRLALICALIHYPQILVLDEPTAGVDPVSRRIFWELIFQLAKSGITVLVTTHYMDEAESCDLISFIFKGKTIATGQPNAMIAASGFDTLEDLFIDFVKNEMGVTVESSFHKLKFIKRGEGI